jgi:outer membrane protein assembly factor BamB
LLRDGRCYTLGASGVLLCRELETGKLLWQRDTLSEFKVPEAFFGVGSSPVLDEGLLFLMVGGQPNSGVVALDAATGRTVWQNVGEKTWTGVPMTGWPGERRVQWNPSDPAFQKQASYCTPVLATIHGRKHLLCCTRQGLVSLDPKTGAANFSFWFRARQDSSVNAMTPVVSGDTILISSAYFRSGSVLLRVLPDGRSVEEVWRGLQLEMHWSRPVLVGGFLYAFSGRNEPDGRFRCVEMATGALRWDRPEGWPNAGHAKLDEGEPMPNVFGRGSAIFANGKIIALGEAGLLGLFKPNPEKPEELGRWQVPKLRYPCWAGPVLASGRLHLRSEEWLVCLDARAPVIHEIKK